MESDNRRADNTHYVTGSGFDSATRTRARTRLSRLSRSRPAPGTSDLLARHLSSEVHTWNGRAVRVYDLTRGMSAVSLKKD